MTQCYFEWNRVRPRAGVYAYVCADHPWAFGQVLVDPQAIRRDDEGGQRPGLSGVAARFSRARAPDSMPDIP